MMELSQHKNKKNLVNHMNDFGIPTEWNFSAPVAAEALVML
jgi:hypothetical protein